MTPTQLGIAHGMMLVRETVEGVRLRYTKSSAFRWPWPRFVSLEADCIDFIVATRRLGAGPRRKR